MQLMILELEVDRWLTENPLWNDWFFELESLAEPVGVLGEDPEVVHLVFCQVRHTERCDLWGAGASRRPMAAVRLAFLHDVALDWWPAIVQWRLPVDGEHVACHADNPDWTVGRRWRTYNMITVTSQITISLHRHTESNVQRVSSVIQL